MVQIMDDNDETARKLGAHVYSLSEVLKRVSSNPRQPEKSRTTNGIEALQQ
ncbi:hypothetical protein FRC05_008743 [Tulasnella sp. 425]|nr:hypothetical protein FRC05_008743 [Tulasnella sp. 425]